jgi:UDPglucose 6-dehydrogenase
VRILVSGLWHLGCVTAACLAENHDVTGHDPEPAVVEELAHGRVPIFEPGLTKLVAAGLASGRLTFSADPAAAAQAEVIWIAFDTPVDAEDNADVEHVFRNVVALLPFAQPGTLVVVSSQVPVGFIKRLEDYAAAAGLRVDFAYVPENLRLGQALAVFREPDRVVAGVRTEHDKTRIATILKPITQNILWMSPESAEMTKHALNGFLATSVTFINEIAGVCEAVGADVKDVERGLKSDRRIGPLAYLTAGGGFAGGTLARDVRVLVTVAAEHGAPHNVLDGVLITNRLQQAWAERTLEREVPQLASARIAILGLTYKPQTDTLRRSTAIELAERLHARGTEVRGFDPAVHELPPEIARSLELAGSIHDALRDADAVVVGTEWPEFQQIRPRDIAGMRRRLIVDPKRHLEAQLRGVRNVHYFGVGLAEDTAVAASEDA